MVALYATALLASYLAAGSGAAGDGAGDVVLLDFYSQQCGPCRQMDPIVARLASYGAPIRKVDVNREQQLAQQFRIQSVPTFVLVVNGREVDRIRGACSMGELGALLKKAQTLDTQQGPAAGPPTGQPSLVASPIATGPPAGPPSRDPFLSQGAPAELPPAAPPPTAPYNPAPPFAAAPASPPAQPALPPHLRGGAFEAPVAASAPDRGVQPAAYNAPMPGARQVSATDLAMAACVRLKVEDQTGFSYGTGTVIHSHGNESLIITCGHIFRDSQGKGPIHVDLFAPGMRGTVQGKLLHYDLDRDIALVTVRTQTALPTARVAGANRDPRIGERVFSVGCNHGQDPTILNGQVNQTSGSRVTTSKGEEVYLVEVSGSPVDGRSGGGLFSSDGELIGICNFADRQAERGFYASAQTVRRELDSNKLAFVYQQPPATDAGAKNLFAGAPPANLPANPMNAAAGANPLPGAVPVGVLTGPIAGVPPGAQVICLVRGPADPNGRYSLYVLEQPSSSFLEQLAKESRHQQGEPTTLRIER